MKAFTKLSIISLLGSVTNTHAANDASMNETRKLQQSGQFCNVDASVKCTIPGNTIYGTNVDCGTIGMQAYGTCKETLMTFSYEYCNRLPSSNVNPLRTNAGGEDGTVAMYRQQWGKPALLLGGIGPEVCRVAKVTELVDTCKKRVVGDIKFEGWVDGRVDQEGYYCYAYDFLEVPFYNEEEPPVSQPDPTQRADISLSVDCYFTASDGSNNSCENLKFLDLDSGTCNVFVKYNYKVLNNSEFSTRLDALVDESLVPITSEDIIIEARNFVNFERTGQINVCEIESQIVEKRAFAVASPLDGGIAGEARANLDFEAPSQLLTVELNDVTCQINDGSGTDCNSYLLSIVDETECFVDMMFKYTFTKTSAGCGEIDYVRAYVEPLGAEILAFEDHYSCQSRDMCMGDAVTIPDRRFVNLCEISQDPRTWDIAVIVGDAMNRDVQLNLAFEWPEFEYPGDGDRGISFDDDGGNFTIPEVTTYEDPAAAVDFYVEGVACQRKPVGIKFAINPTACDESSNSFMTSRRFLKHNSQNNSSSGGSGGSGGSTSSIPSYPYSCQGPAPSFDDLSVKIFDIQNSNEEYDTIHFSSLTEFSIVTPVPDNMKVVISSNVCDQEIVFHASCSSPLKTGDTMGSFEIVEFIYN